MTYSWPEESLGEEVAQEASLLGQEGNSALWKSRVPDHPTDPHIFLWVTKNPV